MHNMVILVSLEGAIHNVPHWLGIGHSNYCDMSSMILLLNFLHCKKRGISLFALLGKL